MTLPTSKPWFVVYNYGDELSGGPGYIYPPESHQYGWYASHDIARAESFPSASRASAVAEQLRLRRYDICKVRVVVETWHRT